jgi:hypothetical protein
MIWLNGYQTKAIKLHTQQQQQQQQQQHNNQ